MPKKIIDPSESLLNVGDAFVAICDWNGVVRWLSNHTIKTQIGDLGWSNMIEADARQFKEAFALTATAHEKRVVEISSIDGLRYRIWLMSIGVPELAVCTFNLRIPPEIEKLSNRERELMEVLATGQSLKEAATRLDCSINTVHTHIKNIKTKLRLKSPSEVTSFASRFFSNIKDPLKIIETSSASGSEFQASGKTTTSNKVKQKVKQK